MEFSRALRTVVMAPGRGDRHHEGATALLLSRAGVPRQARGALGLEGVPLAGKGSSGAGGSHGREGEWGALGRGDPHLGIETLNIMLSFMLI